ncbi:carboxypeptidase [Paramyrothecium foliicola]|nr:carboxypeptidase [Paramyrothecium foliicola]
MAAPILNLNAEEKRVYGQLFRQADSDGVGVVTGETAVKFFEKTRLDSRILGEIWQIADKENRGFLTPAGFGTVLRLIGHAQAGREPTPQLAFQQGPIPRFDGFFATPAPVAAPTPPAPIQAQGTGGLSRIPPLTPEKVAQYTTLFERQPLQGNMLPGEQARQIFDKSGLPNETLGRIWELSDTEQRGALVLTEFVIAMHLLTSMKTGTLRALPNVLPSGLYEAATMRGAAAAPRQSPTSTGMAAIPRQLSGTVQPRTSSPLGRPPMAMQPTATGSDWAVSPADKARFDQIYTDLDKGNKGFLTGEEAVPFLSKSELPEDTLAQIWDYADFHSQGTLTREGFAVAMYLIRQLRNSRSTTLPSTLPPNLVPPSVRQSRLQNTNSAFEPPPVPAKPPPPAQPKSALEDLFGLDSAAPTPPPAASATNPPPAALQTMSTGGSNANDPFAGGSIGLSPSSPARASPTINNTFKPFVPSSSFGRGLTAQPTGDSFGSNTNLASQQSASEDLLADNDPEASKKITGETTELANLSSQIGTLSKQMQDVQSKRTATQNELNQTNSQKQNFEQRLAQLRSLYEKEAQDTRALEEQLRNSRSETKKLQGECLTLEGTYKDIQAQHQQTLTALQADQQENTNLRERIRVVNAEIAQLKPQIEKLKSEARQQKGLVAINKKQLSTTEGEREKFKTEVEDLTRSNEELSRQLETGSPVSVNEQVVSPAASISSANNPFFKRSASTDIMGAFASPPARTFSDKSFDEVFGSSFSPAPTGTPPPTTSFKQQNAETSSINSFPTPPAASPTLSRQATLPGEPPAPPESRQINSTFLPFPAETESLTSSRQVSPPMSRAEGQSNEGISPFPAEQTAAESAVPGAFPTEETANKDTPNTATATNEPAAASKTTDSAAAAPDPFSSADNDQAKAKADFDNAFAAFSSSNKSQTQMVPQTSNAASAFDSEFPPISEIERDDDSDSNSEDGGFADDFAPASPPAKNTGKDQPVEATPTQSSTNVGIAAPSSPVPSKDATQPTEFTNRSAEHLSSPSTVTAAGQQTSSVDHIFGAATTGAAPSASQPAPSNPPAKGAFDDIEDDFEGLEDAKEGSADDDFANISRSGLDDFNAVFDSSPPASQAKSESTAFGNESSFDFVPSNPGTGASASSGGTQQKAADAHDWDAIFSGLDTPTAAATEAAPAPAATAAATDAATDSRPGLPGRALTTQGEHDDPILKHLTGMGYARGDALAALEKYDYNLERSSKLLHSPTPPPPPPNPQFPALLNLAHDGLGPAHDVHLGRARLDGVEHAALEVVAYAQHGLDPADVQVPVGALELVEDVDDGVLVGGEQAQEGLGDAPGLLDGGGDVRVGQAREVLEGCGDVVEELVLEGVGAAQLGALVAHRREVAHEQLVGEDLGEDVDERVVQDLAVVAEVLVKGDDHLLHGGAGVPLGREEVGHDVAEVDGEDEVGELGDAPGAEVDVAVAQLVQLLVRALEVLRRDARLVLLFKAAQVAEAALVLVVVDARDLVVGRGDEPVLHGLEALELGDLARLEADGLLLEHALPRLLPVAQAQEHGVDDTFDDIGPLRVERRLDLLAQHAPKGDEVLGAEVAVLVLVEVGALDVAAGKVLLLLLEDAVDPLVEELDDELTEVSDELSLTVVYDVRRERVLTEANLGHFLIVLLGEANNLKGVSRAGLRAVHHADQKVVHELVVDVGIRLGDVPLLGHQGRHADLDGVQVVEVPLHDLLELAGVVQEVLLGLLELLLGAEADGLQELVLVAAHLLGTVGDALEAGGHLLVVLERLLEGEDALADVLVEPVDCVVQPGKVVLQRGLETLVLGPANLLHGIVANIPQLGELVVARQQVRHVLLVLVILLQHILHEADPLVERLEVATHRLDGAEVAMCLRHEVDAGKILDHGLRLRAQLVNLHHLLLDHLNRLLAVAEAIHAGLRRLELLTEAASQLGVHSALLARELKLHCGNLVQVVRVPQQL